MSKKFDKIIHSKFFIIILVGILILTTALVGTYAWFTWNSSENTKFTMTIGEVVDVTFTEGNAISDKLYPVFNYTDGLSTDISINNKSSEETFSYVVYLNITTIDEELTNDKDVKYVVLEDNTIVSQGHLQGIQNSTELPLYNGTLPTGTTECKVYIYMDGNNENDREMIGKSIVGNIMIEAIPVTPVEDFTYYLGSEYSSVDTINYYDEDTGTYSDIQVVSMPLEENEILLTKYNGTSPNVSVPDTYTIDGTTYNVTLLSNVVLGSPPHTKDTGIFEYNTTIKSVLLNDNIKIIYNNGSSIQENNASSLFNSCTNLTKVSIIPSSVTDVQYTFRNCTSLVTAPVIPSSVTSMYATFSGCTSLVNAPVIPSPVTYMFATFSGCTSLVTAPVIPRSVIHMYYTFQNCTNLTGTVRINSSEVSAMDNIFTGTVEAITVEVPTGSTTYTKLNALTTSNGMPSNVTIKQY